MPSVRPVLRYGLPRLAASAALHLASAGLAASDAQQTILRVTNIADEGLRCTIRLEARNAFGAPLFSHSRIWIAAQMTRAGPLPIFWPEFPDPNHPNILTSPYFDRMLLQCFLEAPSAASCSANLDAGAPPPHNFWWDAQAQVMRPPNTRDELHLVLWKYDPDSEDGPPQLPALALSGAWQPLGTGPLHWYQHEQLMSCH